MNNDQLIAAIDYFEREKGIERETLFQAVEDALLAASKRSMGATRDLRIEIDRRSGKVRAYAKLLVVEKVTNAHEEIVLPRALKIKADAVLGEDITVEVPAEEFGRIGAQTAKQAIMQRIRQVEKEKLYDEFKDRAGEIVSGTVRRFERSDVIVDLGKYEAVMPSRERVSTEDYNVGDRVRAYVLAVENGARGPEIILSRSHPNFVRRLFEVEVSEIADRTVEIRSVAREAGYRTKIAVHSGDDKVDPVGACVGLRGARVKNIVRELNNEKVDIIRWSSEPRSFVIEALKPAKIKTIEIDEAARTIHITVDEDQLSLAIGKRGQNSRLTERLLGYKVLIRKDDASVHAFEQRVAQAAKYFSDNLALDDNTARALVMGGIASLDGLLATDPEDIAGILGIEPAQATKICDKARHLARPA